MKTVQELVEDLLLSAGTTGVRQVWFSRAEAEEIARSALALDSESRRMAEDLAQYISDMTGEDLGEQGEGNYPLFNACDAARAYLQRRDAKVEPEESYREGVNVDRLAKALGLMGIAGCGQEEMAACMSQYVNQLTRGVVRHFGKHEKIVAHNLIV